MRRIILIIFIFSFLSLSFFQKNVFADFEKIEELKKTIEEKNQKIKSIQEEILRYQDEIEKKGKESKTLSGEISRLNLIIKKLNKDIDLTRGQIEAALLILERLEIEIEKTRGEIEKKNEIMKEFLREIYDLDSFSSVEILLGRESVSDFFDGLEEIKNLQEKMRLMVVELKQAKDNQEKQEILAEVDAVEEELRKLIDPASLPKSRPGVLGYPVASVAVTQGFGLTSFSQSSGAYFKSVHNGVDFRASMGKKFLAPRTE